LRVFARIAQLVREWQRSQLAATALSGSQQPRQLNISRVHRFHSF
jgi:hypothetical protein